MKNGFDLYNYKKKIEKAILRLSESNISERNKTLIFEFVDHCKLENLSKARIERYYGVLRDWALLIKNDFDKADKKEIMKAVSILQDNDDFKMWTKITYKSMLKRFYKWLNDDIEYPDSVKWISTRMKTTDKEVHSAGDLITEEEIKQAIHSAKHPRDKAFISILYESGARIGEIGSLQIKNVSFDKYGIMIDVMGKTGHRAIRLISSTPHVMTWINSHPNKDDRESPLWINIGNTNFGKIMQYQAMAKILRNNFTRAGIKKKFNPHFFRHSRASFLADHLTEFQMNQYFGWIQGSDMPSTYVHMNGRKIEDSLLALNGIHKLEEKEDSVLKPKICVKCDFINDCESKFCSKCGGALDVKTSCELNEVSEKRIKSDDLMNLLLKDKNIASLMVQKIKEMGLNC